MTSRRQLTWSLALAGLLAGCAHTAAPAGASSSQPPAPTFGASERGASERGTSAEVAQAQAGEPKKPECVLVTGSRIPRCPEPGSQVAPTDSAMRSYSREDIQSTGRDPNLGDALRALDPSLSRGR